MNQSFTSQAGSFLQAHAYLSGSLGVGGGDVTLRIVDSILGELAQTTVRSTVATVVDLSLVAFASPLAAAARTLSLEVQVVAGTLTVNTAGLPPGGATMIFNEFLA
jgi:hypothetical protein